MLFDFFKKINCTLKIDTEVEQESKSNLPPPKKKIENQKELRMWSRRNVIEKLEVPLNISPGFFGRKWNVTCTDWFRSSFFNRAPIYRSTILLQHMHTLGRTIHALNEIIDKWANQPRFSSEDLYGSIAYWDSVMLCTNLLF